MNSIATKTSRIAVLATALAVMAGCASTPQTYANADPAADFSQYRTFGYVAVASTDKHDYASLETTYLKAAITEELQDRGLVEANDPDLLINFHVHTQEKIRTHDVPVLTGFGHYDPFFDTWGTYGAYRTEVRQFTEGTLTIDVVDAQDRRLVWEGAAIGRVTRKNMQNLEDTVYDAVAEIMKDYPVAPAAQVAAR